MFYNIILEVTFFNFSKLSIYSHISNYFLFVSVVEVNHDVVIPLLKLSVTEDGLTAETGLTKKVFPGESSQFPPPSYLYIDSSVSL